MAYTEYKVMQVAGEELFRSQVTEEDCNNRIELLQAAGEKG